MQREVGNALYELRGIRSAAPVVFGRRTDAAVLGALTLEALGFDLDPLRRAVGPIKRVLLTIRAGGGRPATSRPA